MKHGLRFLAVIILCSLAGAAAYYITPTAQHTHREGLPGEQFLSIPAGKLQLPETWESQAYPWTVPVTNTSNAILDIQAISGSCNCVTIKPQQATLKPGETLPVELIVNHTTKPKSDLTFSLGLTIVFQHPELSHSARARWELSGPIRRHLTGPRELVLRRQSELTVPLLSWRFPITSLEPLSQLTAECDISQLAIRVEPTDTSGKLFELVITPPAQMTACEMQGKLTLHPVSRTAGTLPSRSVRIEATIAPDALIDPVEMGPRPLGSTQEETVMVSSLTNRSWKIEKVTPQGPGLTVDILGQDQVRVRQEIRQLGHQQHHIQVLLVTAGHHQMLSVPVIYTGIEPSK